MFMVNSVSSWENNKIVTPPFSYLSTVKEGIYDNLFVDIGFLGQHAQIPELFTILSP